MNDTRTVTVKGEYQIDVVVGKGADGETEIQDIEMVTLEIGRELFSIGDAVIQGYVPHTISAYLEDMYQVELFGIIEEMDKHEHEEHLKGKAADLLHERAAA